MHEVLHSINQYNTADLKTLEASDTKIARHPLLDTKGLVSNKDTSRLQLSEDVPTYCKLSQQLLSLEFMKTTGCRPTQVI